MKRDCVNSWDWPSLSAIQGGGQNVHELDAIGRGQFFAGRDGVRPRVLCDGLAQGVHRTHPAAFHGFKQGAFVGDGEQFPDFRAIISRPAPVGLRNKGNGQRSSVFGCDCPAPDFVPQGAVLVRVGDDRSGSVRRRKEPFAGNVGKPARRPCGPGRV